MSDVAIIGGGPAGLTAALQLGRARRRVLVLDAGEPRHAKAHAVQGFLTRDGTPPPEMRRLAHEDLARYRTVERRGEWVERVEAHPDRVTLRVGTRTIDARRVLLATGMVDDLPTLPGFRELWGESIFQCPYCHGWEVQDQPFGYWARNRTDGRMADALARLDERCDRVHGRRVHGVFVASVCGGCRSLDPRAPCRRPSSGQ